MNYTVYLRLTALDYLLSDLMNAFRDYMEFETTPKLSVPFKKILLEYMPYGVLRFKENNINDYKLFFDLVRQFRIKLVPLLYIESFLIQSNPYSILCDKATVYYPDSYEMFEYLNECAEVKTTIYFHHAPFYELARDVQTFVDDKYSWGYYTKQMHQFVKAFSIFRLKGFSMKNFLCISEKIELNSALNSEDVEELFLLLGQFVKEEYGRRDSFCKDLYRAVKNN